jgi:transcriptional regulator GlxA family with amidase domain
MATIDVCFLILPGTLLLDLAGPAETFRLANQALGRQGKPAIWRLRHLGPEIESDSSVGLRLANLEPLPTALAHTSWIFLLGQPGNAANILVLHPAWQSLRNWLATVLAPVLNAGQDHRLWTVCSGALLAADAGLLNGQDVTTHHELLDDLTRLAPSCKVQRDRVFVEDGWLLSSAGITAGIDLALHGIAQVCGEALAAEVAQMMVVYHRRGHADRTESPLLSRRRHLHPALHRVQDAVGRRPAEAWTTERMAAQGAVTPRHLRRLFAQHVGCSPRTYVEQVRLIQMRDALSAGVAKTEALLLAGFHDERQWRRARERGHAGAAPNGGTTPHLGSRSGCLKR